MPKCDLVLEGGGVKGIGLVGAAQALEAAGYTFENLAGTSAGAIVAALLAAGYSGQEIEEELVRLDYRNFKQAEPLDHLGVPGKFMSMIFHFGLYKADFFEHWLVGLLARKGKTVFGDIRAAEGNGSKSKWRMQAVASDITDRTMLVLPRDLSRFGLDPDGFPIARAVRMSMSIPLFYEPCLLTDSTGVDHLIVDGGLLSNYPLWLLDGEARADRPVFGCKFSRSKGECAQTGIRQGHPIAFAEALVSTALDAHDNHHISTTKGDLDRSILIPTDVAADGKTARVSTTDFGISKAVSMALLENGRHAAETFLAQWNFSHWKTRFLGL